MGRNSDSLKPQILSGKISNSEKEHVKSIARFVQYYNYERFPTELYGLNPFEVLNNKIPDKHLFREQIIQARAIRLAENKAFNGCKEHSF